MSQDKRREIIRKVRCLYEGEMDCLICSAKGCGIDHCLSALDELELREKEIETILYDYCHWFKSKDSCKNIAYLISKAMRKKRKGR